MGLDCSRMRLRAKRQARRSPAKARAKDWVSKTDLSRYVRCPYAFWLARRCRRSRATLTVVMGMGEASRISNRARRSCPVALRW